MPSTPSTPCSSPAVRQWGRLLALVAGAVGLLMAAAVPSAVADTCPNAVLRAENGSTSLPDCRAYEMVSPPYKQGFTIDPKSFADGIVSYQSTGNFAGNAQTSLVNNYHAVRSAAGWITSALAPPRVAYNAAGNPAQAESADLGSSLWLLAPSDQQVELDLYLRGPNGVFQSVGPDLIPDFQPGVEATSSDLSHVVFNSGVPSSPLREYVGTGNAGPPRPVSVDNIGQQTAPNTCISGMSADGRVIAWTSGCQIGVPRLWARVAGSATVEVSRSECTRTSGDVGGPCNGTSAATYAGSSADGSRLFFTTNQQLINADTDATSDLYACDIPAGAPAPVGSANGCDRLVQVSGAATGADVDRVIAISKDGSRVYFVAKGVLADNVGVGDVVATPSVDNLYLWERDAAHPSGQTRFVVGLAPAGNDLAQAELTPDGRYLVFTSANALVAAGPGADIDGGARDVYRYDAERGTIVRVSTATSGGGGNSTFDARVGDSIQAFAPMTDDGSSIVFETGEALSPSDTDGVGDVYVWHDGQVSLISTGGGKALWISPTGRDVFFSTNVPLVATDGDVNGDIYDARVDGGFNLTTSEPCSGAECRGRQSVTPDLADPPAPQSLFRGPLVVAPAFSVKTVTAAQRKRLAATGKVALTVTSNAAGTISAKATAKVKGKATKVASGRRTLAVPGTESIGLVLSRLARAQLADLGRLSVKVAVDHSKVALDRYVTLALVHPKARKKANSSQAWPGGYGGVAGDRYLLS